VLTWRNEVFVGVINLILVLSDPHRAIIVGPSILANEPRLAAARSRIRVPGKKAMNLKGAVAVVTGGNGGLGQRILRARERRPICGRNRSSALRRRLLKKAADKSDCARYGGHDVAHKYYDGSNHRYRLRTNISLRSTNWIREFGIKGISLNMAKSTHRVPLSAAHTTYPYCKSCVPASKRARSAI